MPWYVRALTTLSLTAMVRYMHNRGIFVPVNHTIAREWYGKAAAKNQSEAWGALGVTSWLGQGVEQNHTAAFEALKRQVCGAVGAYKQCALFVLKFVFTDYFCV